MPRHIYYGDKLKGISPENAVDAAHHALAQCQAKHIKALDSTTYNDDFVPAFMARLGIEDVEDVPTRAALQETCQSHLAKKEEETTKKESETYRPTTLSRRRRLAPVVKSPDELSTERMAPVRDVISKAISALQKASGVGKPTRRALSALGFSGDGLLSSKLSSLDDKPYALRWATLVLPSEHGVPLQEMSDGKAVWCAVLQYHEGLGNGALEKLIAATRERCNDLTSERLAVGGRNQNIQHPSVGVKARIVAGAKRKQNNADAEAEAFESLKADDFADDQGVRLPPQSKSTFHRPVKRLSFNVPDYVLKDPTRLVYAVDAETEKPVVIKAGEMQEKWIFGRASVFQLGIGMNKDQDPIGEIVRDTAGDAVLMRHNAWNGYQLDEDRFVTHRGRKGPLALCFDLRDRASTWAEGGHDDMALVPSALGLKLVSSRAVETTVGTLEDFQHARFESTGEIPGGLEALMVDCEVLSAKMRAASVAAAGSEVWLANGVQLERLGSEGTVRYNIVTYSRCAGSISKYRQQKLDYLESEGLMALHYISLRAALLGHVQVRLVAYAHAAAGNFHPDGSIVGPIRSSSMARAAAMAAPASLRSWNFSSGMSGPMPALMGPALGPSA